MHAYLCVFTCICVYLSDCMSSVRETEAGREEGSEDKVKWGTERNKTGAMGKGIKRKKTWDTLREEGGWREETKNSCERARGRKGQRGGGREVLLMEMTDSEAACPLSWHTRWPSSHQFSQVCGVT